MARRSRQSILKRQRELKRAEKAAAKREKREERRRRAAEGEDPDLVDMDESGVEASEEEEFDVESISSLRGLLDDDEAAEPESNADRPVTDDRTSEAVSGGGETRRDGS